MGIPTGSVKRAGGVRFWQQFCSLGHSAMLSLLNMQGFCRSWLLPLAIVTQLQVNQSQEWAVQGEPNIKTNSASQQHSEISLIVARAVWNWNSMSAWPCQLC